MNILRNRPTVGSLALAALILITAVDGVYAQRRGGRGGGRDGGGEGGGENGGEEGGRGDRRGGWGGPGGMPGGPGGMPGGPGGMRGGFGGPGGGPAGFLARMDANGNGMLDPEESQGPARMFLDRIAGEAKLDLSRPIPLDAVTKAFEEMRNRRMQEMDPGRGGDENDQERGGNRGSSSSSDSDFAPLVPGFGEPDLFDPIPGFGDLGERFAVKVEEQDRQEAQRTLGRNDANKDGVLDAEEISRGRWGEDPLQTDRNRDGKLSLDELALRYAIRRSSQDGGNTNRGRTARGGTNSRGGGNASSGSSSQQNDRQNRMVEMIFQRYDRNRSGTLERDEWGSFRSDPSGYDANKDDKITREEFAAGMAGQMGDRGRGGDRGGQGGWYAQRGGGDGDEGDSKASPSPGSSSASDRKSYRVRNNTERLATLEGLPEWFARCDADADGQVRMSEYATSWSDDVAADFAQFDLNGDGIVTPKECLAAAESGAVQGIAPTSSRTRSRSDDGDRGRLAVSTETSATPSSDAAASAKPAPETAGGGAGVSAQYMKFAVGLISKYDTNKDGVLTADEWTKMNKDYSGADTDKDGRITPAELGAAFSQTR